MEIRTGKVTRREFAQLLAASAASQLVASGASALKSRKGSGFGFVGCVDHMVPSHTGSIHVFRISGAEWTLVDTVAAAAPVHLTQHPVLPVFYAVHGLDLWDNLPRGAVSEYRFDPATGILKHMVTQPLSLGATGPRSAAVATGGRSLFVAAERGGIYNLLPIAADGTLQPVTAIRKELGTGEGQRTKRAAPRQVTAHLDGSVLTFDPGQETLSRFTLEDGAITLLSRSRIEYNMPRSSADVLPGGEQRYGANADGTISTEEFTGGEFSRLLQPQVDAGGAPPMRMLPKSRPLTRVAPQAAPVLRGNCASGGITAPLQEAHPIMQSLSFTPDCAQLIGFRPGTGEILSLPFGLASGAPGPPRVVARVEGCRSILFRFDL